MNDQRTVQMVVAALAAIALVAIVASVFKPAAELTAIGSAAVGALASLLASTKASAS